MRRNRLADFVLARARELVDLRALFVELEGRHRLDAACRGNLLKLVNVDLDKDDVRHLPGQRLENGRDALARAAPRCREVDDYKLLIGNGRVKLCLARQHLHAATEAEHQMQRRFLLDVVIGERATILELLASEDEALLVGWDALLVLDLGLYVVNAV